jgi:uncharacterized protein (TIGR03437 family)
MFPANNAWNVDLSAFPVLGNSSSLVASIGVAASLHPDFGTTYAGAPWGIPFIVVDGSQPYVPIYFTAYGDESDPGPYPVPLDAPVEGGPNSTGDRHVVVFNSSNRFLYELYRGFPQGNAWNADSAAVFDTTTNGRRPLGWTSADAAGLPILAGLARYEEVECGAIRHALRFTAQRTRKAYIHPASHYASSNTDPNLPAMGQRFRLKATFDTSSFPPQARIVLQALKTYGMMVADNGGNWFISGAPNPNWNDADIDTLKRVHGSDFEAVDTTSIVPPGDNIAPVGPSNLALVAASSTQIDATWAAANDNLGVAGYRVTVSVSSSFSNPLPAYAGRYVGNALSTTLIDLNPSTTYFVQVLAYDEAGNVSSGTTASATTLAVSGGEPALPRDFAVASAATLQTLLPVAPGSLASLFVSSTGVSQTFSANKIPLPPSLGGVSLLIGGSLHFAGGSWIYSPTGSIPAPLLFVGSNQVNFQVPTEIAAGDAIPAQLTRADGTKALGTLRVASAAPGVFTLTMNGQGQAAVVNQDNSGNVATNPAQRGTVIQVYGTGAGNTLPPLNSGESAPANGSPLVVTQEQPIVTIGGLPAQVSFSGMTPGFVGLWQINVRVPDVQPGPTVPLVVSIGGVTASTVTMAVE